jgi:hypothetical protein
MIIGINGKIGSGKDTVGKIIQYLCCTPKSVEDFEHMKKFILDDTHKSNLDLASNYKIKKFAGKLKEVASLLTGVPVALFEDQEFKKTEMPFEWGMTYRTFLQKLGTEAMRDGLHVNTWINALYADYIEEIKYIHPIDSMGLGMSNEQMFNAKAEIVTYSNGLPKWIITDMRFPNEMESVVIRAGITIRVKRTPRTVINGVIYLMGTDGLPEHPSETGLDNAKFDYELDNNGTINELIEKVREILIIEKII